MGSAENRATDVPGLTLHRRTAPTTRQARRPWGRPVTYKTVWDGVTNKHDIAWRASTTAH